MVGLQRERIAEVWAWSGRNGGTSGSGYLVDRRHILTAAHVVEPASTSPAGTCEVRCLGESEWQKARILHRAPLVDIALLELEKPAGKFALPMRWGRIVGTRPFDCSAVGFPEVQRRADDVRDSEQIEGRIQPLGMAKTGQLALSIRSGAPRDLSDRQQTLWAGMSGAAVFANDVLVGVMIADPQGFGTDRLIATSISRVADDPVCAAAFIQASLELHLEAVPPLEGIDVPRVSPSTLPAAPGAIAQPSRG